jgi:hypothetical protein
MIHYEACEQEKSIWIRVKDATRIYGTGRTLLTSLRKSGMIKYAKLDDEGNGRGTVLILRQSLEDYIESRSHTVIS